MQISKVQKAAKIIEKIKAIDAEIIEIDRIAMLVANGNSENSFDLIIKEIKQPDEDKNPVLDADGSLINQEKPKSLFEQYALGWLNPIVAEPKKDENITIFKNLLSEKSTLLILGVLLEEKHSKRQSYVKSLQKIGIEIN